MTVQLQNLNTIHFKKEEKEKLRFSHLKHSHYFRVGSSIVFTQTIKYRHISTYTYICTNIDLWIFS